MPIEPLYRLAGIAALAILVVWLARQPRDWRPRWGGFWYPGAMPYRNGLIVIAVAVIVTTGLSLLLSR